MAPKCYICNVFVKKNVSLYRIPDRTDEYSGRCGLWLKLLEERPENMHNIRICSTHFLNSNFFRIFFNFFYTRATQQNKINFKFLFFPVRWRIMFIKIYFVGCEYTPTLHFTLHYTIYFARKFTLHYISLNQDPFPYCVGIIHK